ncbi:MAG: nucleoside triphosphate pyrophosphohydrolase [Longimicrobiales bacterium]|nr:nucleoside triphosphate pyrophosphohydrolase [Longimicrobiales bacterium]
MNDTPSPPPNPAPGADHARTTPGHLDRAVALVRFLRSACPRDAAQTAESLVPHLLEEAAETADAIHHGDGDALEDELGDLLLNLAFQIVVAEEEGTLDAESVTRRIEAKMRRRHPHLYGDGPEVPWEAIKARERAEAEKDRATDPGVLAGLPRALDPLTAADRIQARVAGVGFDWEDAGGALAKVREELEEVAAELAIDPPAGRPPRPAPALVEEIGDLLFAVVNLARLCHAHPTTALAAANRKFTRRFGRVEELARVEGIRIEDASLEALDRLWERTKAEEGEEAAQEPAAAQEPQRRRP